MICPHCKRENLNEKSDVCEYCKQSLQDALDEQEGVIAKGEAVKESTSTVETMTDKGVRNKHKKKITFIIVLLVVTIIVALAVAATIFIVSINSSVNVNTVETTKSAAQIEQEEFDEAYSKVQRSIKSSLRDPESLQIHDCRWKNTPPVDLDEESSEYVDMNCKFVMEIDMSAKNGFGGLNRVNAYALCYDDGSVRVSYNEDDMNYLIYKLTYLTYTYVEK